MQAELPLNGSRLLSGDWLAEVVRFTCFCTPRPPQPNLWSLLTGEPASEVSERPTDLLRIEAGEFLAGGLVITQQPGRVDYVYGAKVEPQLEVEGRELDALAHIGPGTLAVNALLSLVNGRLDILSNAHRLAIAPVLVRQGIDNAAVLSFILENENLPARLEDTDIAWQINRPRAAVSFSGRFNRVLKWNSVANQQITFSMAGGLPVSPPRIIRFARVELDINTLQQSQQPIPFEKPEEVLIELVASLRESMSGNFSE